MATDDRSHGLPAPWRQRLQDLKLVLDTLLRLGAVASAVSGAVVGLVVVWPYSRLLLVGVGIFLVQLLRLLLEAAQFWNN